VALGETYAIASRDLLLKPLGAGNERAEAESALAMLGNAKKRAGQ